LNLMLQLARYPEVLTAAAADFAPHDVTFYLRELAAAYHSYYDSERILVDDEKLKRRGWRWSPPAPGVAQWTGCAGRECPAQDVSMKQKQRGNVIVGIIIGMVIWASRPPSAVAVYVTKVPVPFLNKGPAARPSRTRPSPARTRTGTPTRPVRQEPGQAAAAGAGHAGSFGRPPPRLLPPRKAARSRPWPALKAEAAAGRTSRRKRPPSPAGPRRPTRWATWPRPAGVRPQRRR
jgi:hypothetical protein